MEEFDPSKFIVRSATERDDSGIRNVQVTTWKQAYRNMIPDRILDSMTVDSPPRRAKAPDPKIASSRRAVVAVDRSDRVIGFAVGGVARSEEWKYQGEIWAIYVLPTEQGHGVGNQLFSELKKQLAGEYKNLIIWVLEANHFSHKFYERMGGKKLDLRKTFQWEDQPIATEIAYGWELVAPDLTQT